MAVVTAGSVASIYCPLACTITVTPSGAAIVRAENPNGSDSFTQARILSAQTFSAAAGETVFVEAINADAVYSEPAFASSDVAFLKTQAQTGPQHPRVYLTRGYRETVLVNGAEASISPVRQSYHDLLRAWPSLIDPLTSSANFGSVNVAQALTPIPGAVSAPYWTDPGALTYNTSGTGNGLISAAYPNQIDFVTHSSGDRCLQLTTPEGYGDGQASKRRVQINSYQVTTRIPVAWDFSFLIPDADDAPYDVATGYDYPVLVWQLKESASQPVWQFGYETTSDPDVFDLYVTFLYSDDDADVSTYRRQYNAVSGTVGDSNSATRVCTAQINRNQWNELWIEMFLDERDQTLAAGGQGYASIKLNGQTILEWSGPTYMKTANAGATPTAHRWSLGLYRYEFSVATSPQGVPAGLEELDLDRAENPAPYTRQILFRRARMLTL